MKRNNIYSKFLLAGSLLMGGMALTSCEDFLTVLPTNQITEGDFWNDKNDLYRMNRCNEPHPQLPANYASLQEP